jgi:hypothetical protein
MKKNTKTARRMKDTNSQKRRKKRLAHFAGKAQPMEFCHAVSTRTRERRMGACEHEALSVLLTFFLPFARWS